MALYNVLAFVGGVQSGCNVATAVMLVWWSGGMKENIVVLFIRIQNTCEPNIASLRGIMIFLRNIHYQKQ